jgi:hypothetical protein
VREGRGKFQGKISGMVVKRGEEKRQGKDCRERRNEKAGEGENGGKEGERL